MAQEGIELGSSTELAEHAEELRKSGASVIHLACDGQLLGLLAVSDPIKASTPEALASLRAAGLRVVMATGDGLTTARAVGQRLGIDEVYGEVKPADKLALVERFQREGHVVAMAGDGINDAPALAAAHVGVAMGARGATAASEAADVVIIEDSIDHLASAIAVAKGAMRRAKQAALVGVSLSVVAMLAGAFGLLSPTAAALSQEAIDACAILWALVPPLRTSRSKR